MAIGDRLTFPGGQCSQPRLDWVAIIHEMVRRAGNTGCGRGRTERTPCAGQRVPQAAMDRLNITRHDPCPKWTYALRPRDPAVGESPDRELIA